MIKCLLVVLICLLCSCATQSKREAECLAVGGVFKNKSVVTYWKIAGANPSGNLSPATCTYTQTETNKLRDDW